MIQTRSWLNRSCLQNRVFDFDSLSKNVKLSCSKYRCVISDPMTHLGSTYSLILKASPKRERFCSIFCVIWCCRNPCRVKALLDFFSKVFCFLLWWPFVRVLFTIWLYLGRRLSNPIYWNFRLIWHFTLLSPSQLFIQTKICPSIVDFWI